MFLKYINDLIKNKINNRNNEKVFIIIKKSKINITCRKKIC